ncbi:hypothetical protein N7448_002388 [Penicillium atrosanguineum]|uniref:CFEM domain-containing protein n=1 Tax=Penicillium atrosanguineum TaxID=1132637 RepID=A0A9W9PU82_9EURO|nr:uncharacterized protein N7443_005790 [Penicillium atrosanguineum]KAJ5128671.1 hypothetical protein N7526_006837 [Penicillium atrosanguineum]KAJ5144996.1 hypothetical protein N7448_002388 [Penicillium atrosanguineum]KAJ5300788.1 hypothetical protein N7443_005790 [Penicillium atrosanguineum]KAJ5311430.1 hypothetical protein N7476_007290 [Penicillium atrosanguineum]
MKRLFRPLLVVWLLLLSYVVAFTELELREAVGSELSPCAFNCWAQSSAAVNCPLTDTTCQCEDPDNSVRVSRCVVFNCTYQDSIELSRGWAKQCDRPHNNHNAALRSAAVGSGIAAFLMVGLRIIARFYTLRFWWDDWCHITAGVLAIPLTIFSNLCVTYGMGYHLYDINFSSMTDARDLFIWYYMAEIFYCVEIYFIKMSILCLYVRIFPETNFHRYFITTMVLLTISVLILVPMIICQCIPVHSIWDLRRADARCLNVIGLAYANAGVNLATEIAILILPLPLLQKLRVSKSKKAALYAIFGAGILVIAIASARIPSLAHVISIQDPTYANQGVFYWTCAETSVAHVCATALAIRPLYLKLRGMYLLRKEGRSNIPGTDIRRVCSVSKPGGPRRAEGCEVEFSKESPHNSNSSLASAERLSREDCASPR